MYYSLASSAADGTGDAGLFGELWEQHRAAWDRFVDLAGLAVERIEIPYEGTALPGYFFRAGPAGELRRTLIFNNGSDGPVTGAWVQGIADALERGWNAVTFDGPGQNAALVRQGLLFRPDWEKVITPVVDHLLTWPDVDPGKIALLGVSQAGYWVPRSVAFEPRIAAAVADPGVVDVAATMTEADSSFRMKMMEAGEKDKFDKDMGLALRFSSATRLMMAFRMRPYGTTSPYEFFTAARGYALTDEMIGKITCPVLVTEPEHEQFWPGQSRELYDKLPGPKALAVFTEEEGADSHCEPPATGCAVSGSSIGSTSISPPQQRDSHRLRPRSPTELMVAMPDPACEPQSLRPHPGMPPADKGQADGRTSGAGTGHLNERSDNRRRRGRGLAVDAGRAGRRPSRDGRDAGVRAGM